MMSQAKSAAAEGQRLRGGHERIEHTLCEHWKWMGEKPFSEWQEDKHNNDETKHQEIHSDEGREGSGIQSKGEHRCREGRVIGRLSDLYYKELSNCCPGTIGETIRRVKRALGRLRGSRKE